MAVRFTIASQEKKTGSTYTPASLASFVAAETLRLKPNLSGVIRALDPAVGDGQLVAALLDALPISVQSCIEFHCYDTDAEAIKKAETRLTSRYPEVKFTWHNHDFLLDLTRIETDLFSDSKSLTMYDLIIANPPYVRTHHLGSSEARALARRFGLKGRIDLYYAFVLGILSCLRANGAAGVIVSNRFMTVKSGNVLRSALLHCRRLRKVIDFGDTRLFGAAVLPAVFFLGEEVTNDTEIEFTSIYETRHASSPVLAASPTDALSHSGLVSVPDGRTFSIVRGVLTAKEDSIWIVANKERERWLETVTTHQWGTFDSVGTIRVGVKSCADSVFIRDDWGNIVPPHGPELLRNIITHHVARQFKSRSDVACKQILYPHTEDNGRRQAVDLSRYPLADKYLESNREVLSSRKYLLEAGRKWYELWVPQSPNAWAYPKLVFRDISDEPTFWIDLEGEVVNGDCYWLCSKDHSTNLLWLALAVGNSSFASTFYDVKFNNKLYAGRRRFTTQYVKEFPLPNPDSSLASDIIALTKNISDAIDCHDVDQMKADLNSRVWQSFGFTGEEVIR